MRNAHLWRPTKYVWRNGRLIGSRNGRELGVGSRLMADAVAEFYSIALPRFARGRLLDLGCGSAPLFDAYRGYASEIVCADWNNNIHERGHVDVECDLSEPLPMQSGHFDTVIASDVFEHVARPDLLWSEVARVLAPGGSLILNVPFYYCIHERPYDYYRYTEFALRRFADGSGLHIVELGALGGSAHVLADICAKHLQFIPWIGNGLAAIVQGVVGTLMRTEAGRRATSRTAVAFPFAYSMVATKPAVDWKSGDPDSFAAR